MINIDEIIKSKKILIVDDNDDAIFLYKRKLRKKGYNNIIIARNGEDALIKVEEERPHLILLDLELPKLSGIEICKRLKSSEKTKMIDIIIITSHASMDNKLRGIDIGAYDCISKSIKDEQLLVKKIDRRLKDQYENEQKTEEEKIKTLFQVALRVSHDINNPLCTILANGEMLRDSLEEQGTSHRDVRRVDLILQQIEKIRKVVEMLSKATQVISTDYIKGIQMLDLEKSAQISSDEIKQQYFETREYL